MSYNSFAYIYDDIIDTNYKKWVDYIEKIYNKYDIKPALILELACGTGNMTLELIKRGYDVIGLDKSCDMLCVANQKISTTGKEVLLLNQDMTNFELYGSVDSIVCMMDGINYITNPKNILKVFKLANYYLNPGGLFIFDIRTKYMLSSIIGNNTYFEETKDMTYIWRNKYDNKTNISTMDLTFFLKNDDDTYTRFDEVHQLKSYDVKEMKELLKEAGLGFLEAYDNQSFKLPTEKSERIFVVSKKFDAII